MKNLLVLSIVSLFLSCSHNNKQSTVNYTNEDKIIDSSKKIDYEIGSNYFVKNNFNSSLIDKSYIDSKSVFDSVFGVARTMSPQSIPTEIDFSTDIVIPIILDQTNIGSTITIDSVRLIGHQLNVNYTVTEVEPISYVIQPSELIIIKKKDILDLDNLKLKFEKTTKVL
ncbi:hypothetical protein [Faecalibacter macacae]|uniref:Uncharacterized protein n=1 Tax=Faecalibacter macacae TaxID=1859289 RepID=A0A3L9M427_9FLAO|nr:hypothetical protein [Faecalibacter macacae]RLZ07775.1 hypothetical protein EAH69_10940 [Faecalibacter macacae]